MTDLLTPRCTPCLAELDRRPWDRTLAVRVGRYLLGVRGNTPATTGLLQELLAPLRSRGDDARVEVNVSVEVVEPPGVHLVYRDHEVVARRREVGPLLEDLVQLLDEPAALDDPDVPALHACAVLRPDGTAALVPGRHHALLVGRRRRLEEHGLTLLPPRVQRLDVLTGRLLTGCSDAALARLVPPVSPAPLLRALWAPAEAAAEEPLAGGRAVVATATLVANRDRVGMGRVLRYLADVTPRIPVLALPAGAGADDVLARLVGSAA